MTTSQQRADSGAVSSYAPIPVTECLLAMLVLIWAAIAAYNDQSTWDSLKNELVPLIFWNDPVAAVEATHPRPDLNFVSVGIHETTVGQSNFRWHREGHCEDAQTLYRIYAYSVSSNEYPSPNFDPIFVCCRWAGECDVLLTDHQ